MTEKDLEIQQLRRRISALEKANIELFAEYDKAMVENTKLKAENAKLKAERDAAIADLRYSRCSVCGNSSSDKCGMCAVLGDKFEWRGVRE